MRPADCRMIPLDTRPDARGALAIAELGREIPFAVERIYMLHRVPEGAIRGQHGHRRLQQLFIAAAGQFEILVDDGTERATFVLDTPERALYLGPMMWRELRKFSEGALCLVLASTRYDYDDYIFHYEEFVAARRGWRG